MDSSTANEHLLVNEFNLNLPGMAIAVLSTYLQGYFC